MNELNKRIQENKSTNSFGALKEETLDHPPQLLDTKKLKKLITDNQPPAHTLGPQKIKAIQDCIAANAYKFDEATCQKLIKLCKPKTKSIAQRLGCAHAYLKSKSTAKQLEDAHAYPKSKPSAQQMGDALKKQIQTMCYDLPNFSHLPYPSLDTPQVVTHDLKTTTKPLVIFPSASPPELMGKAPLPLNPPPLPSLEDLLPRSERTRPATPKPTIPAIPQWTNPSQVVMKRSPSPAMSIYPDFNLPTMQPPTPIPIPWSTHHQQYSSMESYQEPPLIENPLEDQDSPIEDMPPPKLEPTQYLNTEDSTVHLANKEPPLRVWTEYHDSPPSPISCKHSLSPTSPSLAPIHQRTSREGSYQSITPSASSPIAGTSPQSQSYQSTSSQGSADKPSSTQSSADDADSDMALNWVTINTDYLKG